MDPEALDEAVQEWLRLESTTSYYPNMNRTQLHEPKLNNSSRQTTSKSYLLVSPLGLPLVQQVYEVPCKPVSPQ
ncbi:hypothetical protein JCM5353_000411 [Sporobolomyces roseus]